MYARILSTGKELAYIAFTAFLVVPGTTFAIEVNVGGLSGSIDTTLSYGQLYRLHTPASNLVGIANGGTAASVNGDDGNINYDTGLVSKTGKVTIEADLSYGSTGLFFRGFAFNDGGADDTERTALTPDAERLVKSNAVLRDLYVWQQFDVGNMPGEIRLGEQVVSWGESTFIQNSINTVNPVDVAFLRTPGSELREALVPVGILYGNLAVTENVTVEAYYQYDWEQTEIDPTGSYFSTNDFVGDGGQFLVGAGVGTIPDYVGCPLACTPATVFAPAASATRAADIRPDDGGEYGMAVRLFVPKLNSTEFGFYHIHYNSRLPIINGIVGTTPGTLTGAQYQISYPEDIDLYGVSFNTELGNTGIALQGEYSFRKDAPLQVDDVEILAASLNAGLPNQVTGVIPPASLAPGNFIEGHIERNVSQLQMTATKLFGPVLKADQAVLLGEWAITHVHGMPDKADILLEAPGTYTSGNPNNVGFLTGHTLISSNRFADATSYGYRLAGRLDYNNALFGAVNLQPRFSWQHDVAGITPGPGGNFIAGRKIINLGLKGIYQNQWEVDLSYTGYLGSSQQYLLRDRDFLAFSIKFAF